MIGISSLLLVVGLAGVGDVGRAVKVEGDMPAPEGWRAEAVRDEIAPVFRVERGRDDDSTRADRLVLEGRGLDAVDGRWVREVPVEPGSHYRFAAEYRATGVDAPERSVLARVVWLDARGKPVGTPDYPATGLGRPSDGWTAVSGVYPAPQGAARARIELHLRWAPRGVVAWRGASLTPSEPPKPRKVRVATIYHRPRGTHSPAENLEQFARLVDEAARRGADVACLPEGTTVVGTGKAYADVAEPIPGPSTRTLGEIARKHRIYLVAGVYEREGPALYNVSVLIGRDGGLVGKYRKVCLPREEVEGGITPGRDYPVFDTDFGRVGMMICWDLHYPEVARALSARGAEMIFLPIWGGNETLARARAIENQVYLVASGYDFKSAIFDKSGQPVAEATADPSVLVTEIDLSERLLWPWLGDYRARIGREGPLPITGTDPGASR